MNTYNLVIIIKLVIYIKIKKFGLFNSRFGQQEKLKNYGAFHDI